MSLVLDSSATLAWIYGDETTAAIRALFDQVANEGAAVPALWRLESKGWLEAIHPDDRERAIERTHAELFEHGRERKKTEWRRKRARRDIGIHDGERGTRNRKGEAAGSE